MISTALQSHAIADYGIKLIATVNGIAALLHFVIWIIILLRLPRPWAVDAEAERLDLVVTYGLGVADLLWSVPLLSVGCFWLYTGSAIGWLAAQMVNVLYWYSFTFILVRELSARSIRPGTVLLSPFALFSFWAAWHLWQVRAMF